VISEGDAWHCDVSRDGKWAVIDTQGDGAAGDLIAVNCQTGARLPLVDKISYTRHPLHPHPRISPDGKWVVYNDAGASRAVFVRIAQTELAKFIP
jgi:Tol biopolymer transport system component